MFNGPWDKKTLDIMGGREMKPIIKATKKQRNEILKCHNGVGHLIYKVNEKTTCEVGFFVKNGIPHYLTTGNPIEYNIDTEEE